ncbi:hypothetical protein CMUS01_08504 [Colletotrichum musicola]|uniref:Uncharacterized protein n=1 Tax=Colletotrichum musicola TaxID=2175873 RepID=A0A8H6KBZ7_9PEZI|nr:hypothetical protein CMUS01_08504 [Colletotrichum musicola]
MVQVPTLILAPGPHTFTQCATKRTLVSSQLDDPRRHPKSTEDDGEQQMNTPPRTSPSSHSVGLAPPLGRPRAPEGYGSRGRDATVEREIRPGGHATSSSASIIVPFTLIAVSPPERWESSTRRWRQEATGGDRRQGNMLKPNSFVRIRIVSPIPSFSIRHPARINQVLPSYPPPSTPSFVLPGELLATPGPSSDATTSPTYLPASVLAPLPSAISLERCRRRHLASAWRLPHASALACPKPECFLSARPSSTVDRHVSRFPATSLLVPNASSDAGNPIISASLPLKQTDIERCTARSDNSASFTAGTFTSCGSHGGQ